jgi:dihydrofolate synthase/folylpolyglutamate synthase
MTDFREAYDFLLSLPRFDKRGAAALLPGFERIEEMLSAMNNPELQFHSVLVAGTNGKGSTSSMIAAICTAHGLTVGLHTSPHIRRVTERMRVNGKEAELEWLAGAVSRFRPDIERIQPSFFEATVALSLLHFAERKVDMAVVEVGLGGRLDATNVLMPVACAIAQIDFDHMDFLGDTLPLIAGEKAGILKHGVPAWTNNTDVAVLQTIRDRAESVGSPLRTTTETFPWCGVVPQLESTLIDTRSSKGHRYAGLEIGLRGRYQADNALLALAVVEHLLGNVFPTALEVGRAAEGLRDVEALSGLRGRLQIVQRHPLIVADAAHNPSGIQSAIAWLADVVPSADVFSAAVGVMRDKAVDEIVALLAPRLRRVYPISIATERGLPADELGRRFSGHQVGGCSEVRFVSDVAAAIADFNADPGHGSDGGVLLITGSHYLLEQVAEA